MEIDKIKDEELIDIYNQITNFISELEKEKMSKEDK